MRVSGAGRLADFRERLRRLMVRDADAEDYTEHHGEGVLEYRFQPKKGIPFPALAEASGDYPELRVEAQWEHDGVRGRAVIENGRVVEQGGAQPDSQPGSALIDVSVAEDGRLVLGLVLQEQDDSLQGYAATAERHTFFRWRDGLLELIDPENADAALEEIAFAFVAEWLWYDEEDAPVERARYANYGTLVRGANLRSGKLALLRASGGAYSSLDAYARQAREAIVAQWLNRA